MYAEGPSYSLSCCLLCAILALCAVNQPREITLQRNNTTISSSSPLYSPVLREWFLYSLDLFSDQFVTERSVTAGRAAWPWGEVLEGGAFDCMTSEHCSKWGNCCWASVRGRDVLRAEYRSQPSLLFVTLLALPKSNLSILGRFNHYFSQVLKDYCIFTFKNTWLEKSFILFSFSLVFFHKALCMLLVGMQRGLLSPSELSSPVSVKCSNKRFCDPKGEHSAFWIKSTYLQQDLQVMCSVLLLICPEDLPGFPVFILKNRDRL